MKLGISTSCFYPLETELSLLAVANAGVQNTEIFFNAMIETEPKFVRLLKDIQAEYALNVAAIHPTMSLSESFMLFSAYDRRLQEGLDHYRRYAQIAAEFGAKYIVMHGGKPNDVMDDDGYFERFAKISEAVRQNGAILLQENVVKYRAGNLSFLKRMAAALGDEVSFCLDVKQSVRGGYSPFEVLEAVGKNVKHLHISDHSAENDCLLPLRGTFDFKGFFEKAESLGYDGCAMIEVYKNAYRKRKEVFDSFHKLENI